MLEALKNCKDADRKKCLDAAHGLWSFLWCHIPSRKHHARRTASGIWPGCTDSFRTDPFRTR